MSKNYYFEKNFRGYNRAEKELRDAGYSVGSMQAGAPTGIKEGDCSISKWRNMSKAERAQMDGTITGDFRNGPVVVEFKDGQCTS